MMKVTVFKQKPYSEEYTNRNLRENCPSAFLPEHSGGSVMQPLSPLPVLSLLILIKSRFMPCLMSGI